MNHTREQQTMTTGIVESEDNISEATAEARAKLQALLSVEEVVLS